MPEYLCWITGQSHETGVMTTGNSPTMAAHRYAESLDPIPQMVSVSANKVTIKVAITAGRYNEDSLKAKQWPPQTERRDIRTNDFDDEETAFLQFVEKWKKEKRKKFPSATEWLGMVKAFLTGGE
jgi:hypothetical protein